MKIICNFKQVGLGPTTSNKQSLPTTCESTIDWATTKTMRNVGYLEKMMFEPLKIK
jgi:hypothetical protein